MKYAISFPDSEILTVLEADELGNLLAQLAEQYPEYAGNRLYIYTEPVFCDGEYDLDKPDCDNCDESWLCDDGLQRLVSYDEGKKITLPVRDPRSQPLTGDVWRHHASQSDTRVVGADAFWVTVESRGVPSVLTRARFRYAVSFCEFAGSAREVGDDGEE